MISANKNMRRSAANCSWRFALPMSKQTIFQEILTPEHVRFNVTVDSKKRALQLASELLVTHLPDTPAQDVLDHLVAREKLGSTNIGHGVAVPHARLADVEYPVAALIHLKNPVDFGNFDQDLIDIVFALIVPKDDNDKHLEILSSIAKAFNNKGFRNCMRHAKSDKELYQKAIDYYAE